MAEYNVVDTEKLDSNLTAVADAIRQKAGTSRLLSFPEGMAEAVANIPTGGGIPENYVSKSVLEGTAASVTFPDGSAKIRDYAFFGFKNLAIDSIPEGVTEIGMQAFRGCPMTQTLTFPSTLRNVKNYSFQECANIRTVTFKCPMCNVAVSAFHSLTGITDIYVPWAEGEVAHAPWGATNATIHYNYTEEE